MVSTCVCVCVCSHEYCQHPMQTLFLLTYTFLSRSFPLFQGMLYQQIAHNIHCSLVPNCNYTIVRVDILVFYMQFVHQLLQLHVSWYFNRHSLSLSAFTGVCWRVIHWLRGSVHVTCLDPADRSACLSVCLPECNALSYVTQFDSRVV